tara:strand:- start:8063 stop:8500 length:438 start_codon:yes stop_codon:yes gene_type:complete
MVYLRRTLMPKYKANNNILDIDRKYYKDCTVSRVTGFGMQFMMLELPWLDNKPNISCIPEGLHAVKKRMSPSKRYEVIEYVAIRGRTYIQIHVGNFTSQILGCQLTGDGVKDVNEDGILDVTNSEKVFNELMSRAPDEFMVRIHS